jgi:hypothetical protein
VVVVGQGVHWLVLVVGYGWLGDWLALGLDWLVVGWELVVGLDLVVVLVLVVVLLLRVLVAVQRELQVVQIMVLLLVVVGSD